MIRIAAWACLSFAGAVFLSQYALPSALYPWAAALCALIAAGGFFTRGNLRRCLCLVGFGALAGLLSFHVQTVLVADRAEAFVGREKTVSARVIEAPDIYEGSEYITVRLTADGMPAVRCRVASYENGVFSELTAGDEVNVHLSFRSASERDGESIDTYTSRGIFLRAVCEDAPTVIGRWRGSFLYAPQKLAALVSRSCEKLFPSDTAPFFTALLTGDKSLIYTDGVHRYALSEAGLSHVIAVSGMHISFLVGFFFLLAGRQRASVIACMAVLVGFAAMTGFTPSVSRAAFMQIALLTAPLFLREYDLLTALSMVLALLLLLNPRASGSVSLQLSFAAVLGIALVSERLYRAMSGDGEPRGRKKKSFLRRMARQARTTLVGIVAATVGALVFTVPLSALHFGYISVVSPISNVLCLPIISVLYIGGYLTVLLGALFPPLGALSGSVLAWGVRYIYWVIGLLAKLPCETVYLSNPIFVLWLVFVYVLFLTAWLFRDSGAPLRPIVPICLSVLTLCVSLTAARQSWREEMTVTALDVGQGACTVLTSGEHSVAVDCGGSYTSDAGAVAVRYLRGNLRRSLDALVLTHLHSDHANGAAQLLSQIEVGTLYLPENTKENSYLTEILAAAESTGTRVVYVTEDMALTLGDMELTLWAPLLPAAEDQNENCLIALAAQDGFEALITGDSPAEAEWLLAARYELPDAEVLVVGHHGSKTATGTRLLEELRPDTAIISVGYNEYGHPHEVTLERLAKYNIDVLRTDELGNITVRKG